jgi:hypothetical protein
MKKITLITTLLLSFILILGMSQAVFAENEPADGGEYVYDGNTITKYASDETLPPIEPGDSVTIDFTYTNESDATTYWYMENTILQTLEEADEQYGGYSYTLSDNGEVLFRSDAIGGEVTPDGISQGLKGVNDALKGGDGDEKWFFIQELGPHESGHTHITVALDGETQVNSYMDATGLLELNYGVEKQAPGKDKVINKPGAATKTGDTFNPLYAIIALTAALLAMLLAILSYLRDRKDGEEA